MNSVKTALLFGAGLLLTIALITIFVQLFGTATDASKQATNDYAEIQTELSEQKYLVYEGTTVSGSHVSNALRKFSGEDNFGIMIKTGKNPAGTWYHYNVDSPDSISTGSGQLADTNDPDHNEFVNPSGNFKSSLVRDSNNVIRAIVFEQQ